MCIKLLPFYKRLYPYSLLSHAYNVIFFLIISRKSNHEFVAAHLEESTGTDVHMNETTPKHILRSVEKGDRLCILNDMHKKVIPEYSDKKLIICHWAADVTK
ncbi:hypothetical protein PHYBLDRAFT_162810 [Phycomyces blakesleeanus NRRL 1555(-)]|uniref:Uncharacterized protein n=1 Tax=Phycomyces blakesleeanus (strain ATCC 8743b / DSM 1359 / FGSC 10004 / NBRC 33097 / NRRL 1555) TaxID=763407 RepID=A0A167QIJ2_PHYB8|nr:hypothetical protein PHYBLDRAFT_162810 [Phycomyces blakesleeanus NRRL 1555(-)]OAD79749.1 hypothetical protein PHYBLDRAFT_162810 [Phycomyces blakesleeanus NRRL 1555(-)]|eukprot:XP_018297789.1 hypothetical protein PHYBLDRAFT_162810 [Phycomyces blakesleeanus NRRL 1555(-)]